MSRDSRESWRWWAGIVLLTLIALHLPIIAFYVEFNLLGTDYTYSWLYYECGAKVLESLWRYTLWWLYNN